MKFLKGKIINLFKYKLRIGFVAADSSSTLASDEDSSDGGGGPQTSQHSASGIGSIMVAWWGDAGSNGGFKAAMEVRKVQCVSLTSHMYCDRIYDLCILHPCLPVSHLSVSLSDVNFQFDSIAALAWKKRKCHIAHAKQITDRYATLNLFLCISLSHSLFYLRTLLPSISKCTS